MAPFLEDDAAPASGIASSEGLEPIAVVGMSFRGPGDADTVENLWKMIAEKREGRTEIPKERWNNDAFYHPDKNRAGSHDVKYGHFLAADLAKFDAPFFNMTAAEAAALDPLQRLLLEASYQAAENAGVPLEDFCGTNTSVFAGSFTTDYTEMLWRDPQTVQMYQCTNSGHSRSNIANRLSYFYDLKGPSVSVDTACSTSLIALHLGCQSIWTGDATQSLVAGASVILGPEVMMTMSMMRFLSPDGRCYTFDARGNGYARGEGVGCLLLKSMKDAIRDGDTIRAVIRGTGSNQDGKTPGITMPSKDAQQALARHVYARAHLDPGETDYVECHGTGTQAGDPLETEGLSRVFCQGRSPDRPLRIGSIKTNIGHLEGASGVAGVIKAILMLENEIFLPNRNFETPNPRIHFEDWKLKVTTEWEKWEKSAYPRRASVNSFGYGGANAHVVLESARDFLEAHGASAAYRTTRSLLPTSAVEEIKDDVPEDTTKGVNQASIKPTTLPRLFLLSGFDDIAAKQQAQNLKEYLEPRTAIADESLLNNLAYTLGERRSKHLWKAAIHARSADELVAALSEVVPFTKSSTKQNAKLGFIFTGQGAQYPAMGKELIALYPVFRQALEKASEALRKAGADFDAIEELTKVQGSQINQALFSQPLCSVLQIGIVDLLASWDIKPTAVTGHSSGEIAAAYAVGALSLEDAVLVAYQRGVCSNRLVQETPGKGAMLAVGMGKEAALPLINGLKEGKAGVACSNSPSSITVSGDVDAIDELSHILTGLGVFNRKLLVEVAYHSHHMAQVADEYRAAISGIKVNDAKADFFSSVTGKRGAACDLGPDYWVANLLGEVKFSQSLNQLCLEAGPAKKGRKRGAAIDALLEIGPHSALAGPVRQILQADEKLKAANIAYHSALVRKKDAADSMLSLVAGLINGGVPVSLGKMNSTSETKPPSVLVDLPAYAFNYTKSYWAEGRISKAYLNREFPRIDLLGALESNSSPLEPRWRNIIRLSELPWIRDHKIQSNIVFPGAGYMVMAVEAALQRAKQRAVPVITGVKLREIIIGAALVLTEDLGEAEVAITLKPYSESLRSPSDLWDEFIVSSVSADNRWTEHCRGLIAIQVPQKAKNIINGDAQDLAGREERTALATDFRNTCVTKVDIPQFYEQLTALGLEYGESFAMMTEAQSAPDRCIGRFKIPDTAELMPAHYESSLLVHPATLDSLFHSIFVALSCHGGKDPAVPVSVEEISISADLTNTAGAELLGFTQTVKKDHRYMSASLDVFHADDVDCDKPVLTIKDITCATLESGGSTDAAGEAQSRAYTFEWEADVDQLSSAQFATLYHGKSAETSATEYLALVGHKTPGMAVLAVGSTSLPVLRGLSGSDGKPPVFGKYEYTDAEVDVAAVSKAEFPGLPAESVVKKNLDVLGDLSKQDCDEHSYDVIVAREFLAVAEESFKTLLKNAKTLLKANGHLLLVGGKTPEDIAAVASQHGFSARVSSADYVFLTPSPEQKKTAKPLSVLLAAEPETTEVSITALQEVLTFQGVSVESTTLAEAKPTGDQVCIVLSDLSSDILLDPSESTFAALKSIFLNSAGVFWISRGAASNPNKSLATGLARTIRSETGNIPIISLDLDSSSPESLAISQITSLFATHFLTAEVEDVVAETEYISRNGILEVSRLVEDKDCSKLMASDVDRPKPELQPFRQPGRPLQITVGKPGLLDTIYFVDDERHEVPLPDDHVQIEVGATGFNFKDVMIALGQIKTESLGWECSGIITHVGANTTEQFAVGDRVVCYGLGTFCTDYRSPAACVHKIPDSMSFETAAAIPVTYATAYYSIYQLARLQKGESVLIHAATGGLGQALIEYSQLIGAEIFATVGTLDKKMFLMEHFGIPEDHIFFSRDGSYATNVKRMTGGRGVDAVMNSLASEGLRLTWDCIAPYGRFVELGARDITVNSRLEMAPFIRNATFVAFNLVYLFEQMPDVANKVLSNVMALFWEGKLKGPAQIHTWEISDVEKAFRTMQTGAHMGKLVAISKPDSMVRVVPQDLSKNLLKPDASYLLVGGLGGIGRATAQWMVAHGAKNLIFANRSGKSSADAIETVEALEAQGAKVLVAACDISDTASVEAAAEQMRESMPPIRGLIQGAMVLRDGLFEKMPLEDWQAVTRCKVQGTWNLHANFPDLDFFVMESSVSGVVGNATQAAYAAANTFLDSFASYRNSLGLAATTVDLGAIGGVGYLATNVELRAAMERQGFEIINEKTLMKIIQFGIQDPRRSGLAAQVITGLGAWSPSSALPSLNLPMFANFRLLSGREAAGDAGAANLRKTLVKAATLEEAADLICKALVEKIADRSGTAVEHVNTGKSMSDYGVDSLVAVEMRNWIVSDMGSTVPILELLGNGPLTALAVKIAQRSKFLSIEGKKEE